MRSTRAICDATKAGIPVIAFNIDHSQGAKGGNCRLAFIGQDFPATGYLIGKRMVEAAHLKAGDLVFTPVEFPDAVYATKRHEGVQKALDEVGAKSEMIGTGGDLPQVLTKEVQYLIGHPEVKAVIGLGAQPMIEIVPAMKQAGVKVPVGGFDLSKEILQGIADGDITATVDQQPYSQGYYAVVQLAPEDPLWPLSVRHEYRRQRHGRQYELQVRGYARRPISLSFRELATA